MALSVTIATAADAEELTDALEHLVPQLSRTSAPPTFEAVRAMLAHDAVTQLVARDGAGAIVGVATLITFPIPTGRRGWVEDVIVDEDSTNQGIGRRLLDAMIAQAQELGCKTLDLTSRPRRAAAIHLYESAGFARRETTVWRHEPGA